MKKISYLFLLYILAFQVNGQHYDIDFEIEDQSETPQNVEITNLTNSSSLMLNGEDILRLKLNSIGVLENNPIQSIQLYPNPIVNTGTIEFYSMQTSEGKLTLFDFFGRLLLQKSVEIQKGTNLIEVSGLNKGAYFLNIYGTNIHSNVKILSENNINSNPSLELINSKNVSFTPLKINSSLSIIEMNFNEGDELKFVAEWDGKFSTIEMIPTQNETLEFIFPTDTIPMDTIVPVNSDSLVDIDNNVYDIITIGNQVWMAENLKVTKYANGTNIPNILTNSDWANLGDNNTDKGYCAQNNNASGEFNTYGALYTYAAATNGDNSGSNVQGVCPTGWHLPSDGEWKTLEMELGMSQTDADDEMISRGTDQGSQISSNPTLWNDGDLENNSNFGNSNFNAIPGGARYDYDGSFVNIGIHSYMWTNTENINNNSEAYARRIDFNNAGIFRAAHTKSYGIAVRCIKD